MRRNCARFTTLTATAVAVLIPLLGCPAASPQSDLPTTAELQRVDDLNRAIESLVSAAYPAASVADAARETDGLRTSRREVTQPITFGECPTLTFNVAAGATFAVTVDFADGCATPLGVTCAGSATGTYAPLAQQITATLAQLVCSNQSLAGTFDVAWTTTPDALSFNGAWNLSYVAAGSTIATAGDGAVTVNVAAQTATVTQFAGDITAADVTVAATLTDVAVSYAIFGTFLPYAGEATLSGDSVRALRVRFLPETPTTGNVEISIANGPFITVNLNEL